MGFLTPTGRAPTSAAGSSTVPTVALSYEWLAQVLSEARRTTLTGRQGGNVDRERDGRVLLELEEHVRREILGEGKAGPEDHVRELWREYGRALRLAMKHRPRLADIREEYLAELEAQFPGDASVELWGKGCDLREIKMNLRSWDEAGFSFTLMLRAWGSELPQV